MANYNVVKNINPTIYRGYDIRGVMGTDLNNDVYYTLGRAYATFLAKRRISEATVGRDNRLNNKEYSVAFIEGLRDGGVDVTDIGLSLSQITYFAPYAYLNKGAAMITASHNPGDFNGVKLTTGYSETMISGEIQEMRQIAEGGQFSSGQGSLKEDDLFPRYKDYILKFFKLNKRWRVVVDCCNSTSGMFLPEILKEAGCEVIEQNNNLDGNFPLGAPDPTHEEVVKRIADGVKKAGADIGFGYDADGDRMAVVDDNGRVLWMDTIVALFALDVLEKMPGAPIVFNTLCSRQVSDTIKAAGGKPMMWLTGHSYIKAKVKEERSPFGGELSGHIFFMDNFFGHDDSAYASLRLLTYLERTNQVLSQAVDKLPQYVSSPEIKLVVAEEVKKELVDKEIRADFERLFSGAEFTDIDGIRMDGQDEMAIIRPSQNGPYITVKFEAKTKEGYEALKKTLKEALGKYESIKWDDEHSANTGALN